MSDPQKPPAQHDLSIPPVSVPSLNPSSDLDAELTAEEEKALLKRLEEITPSAEELHEMAKRSSAPDYMVDDEGEEICPF